MTAAQLDIERLLADPLQLARAAERPIGYVGLDIAEDVLAAPSLCAVHLPWCPRSATPAADRWLEQSFPGWSRSILEHWIEGRFDFLECVIFSRGDDAAQRLYYYVCELQRRGIASGPSPLLYDVARIPRPSSTAWTARAVRRLAADLALDDDALEEGILIANRRRVHMRQADQRRDLPGHHYEQLARASLFAPVDELAEPGTAPTPESAGRVLLAGSSPPDDGLHRIIESLGWTVVGEVCDRNLHRLGSTVEETAGDVAARIAAAAVRGGIGPRSFADRSVVIVDNVERRAADAVIFWLHEEDEALAWDVVRAQSAVRKKGIASLLMARRKWDLSDAPGDDIAAFLKGLEP